MTYANPDTCGITLPRRSQPLAAARAAFAQGIALLLGSLSGEYRAFLANIHQRATTYP